MCFQASDAHWLVARGFNALPRGHTHRATHNLTGWSHWAVEQVTQEKGTNKTCKISGGSVVKNPPASAGDMGSIPGSGRSPGTGHGNPLQYSCLGNPMDRGAWWAAAHGVTKNQTQLNNYTITTTNKGAKSKMKVTIRWLRCFVTKGQSGLFFLLSTCWWSQSPVLFQYREHHAGIWTAGVGIIGPLRSRLPKIHV